MNVALVASSFAPNLGGVEELVRQLAHAEHRRGDHPLICTNRWPRRLPARETFEGVAVRRFAFRLPIGRAVARGAARALAPLTLHAFCRALVRHRSEVLHVQCVGPNAHYAVLAKARLGLPLVVTLQGELTMDPDQVFRRHRFFRDMLERALEAADVVTACSAKTLADVERCHGRPLGTRARVIFNGADPTDFSRTPPFAHPRPYVLALGRLVREKGFDVLLSAMACDRLQSLDLLLAGDGPEGDALRRLASERQLTERVRFLGRTDRPTTQALFNGATLVAVPSRVDEGLPVVCAEALAAGKPCVGTRVGGVPEAVADGETGLLVAPDDPGALGAAIARLGADPELRARMSDASRRRAQLFAWPAIAAQYRAAYDDALRTTRARSVAVARPS